jgi:hypothetical protein
MKTKAAKKNHNKKKFAKLVEDTAVAKKERAKRVGAHKRGIGLEEEEDADGATAVPKKRKTCVCPHPFCELKGHATTSSSKCKANPKNLKKKGLEEECRLAILAAATTEGATTAGEQPQIYATPLPPFPMAAASAPAANDAVDDIDACDGLPLEEDDSSVELCEDAGTWSEDECGNAKDG